MNKSKNQNKDINQKLVALRQEIDLVDNNLCSCLQKRYSLVEKIVHLKKKAQIDMTDKERETEILQRIKQKFPELDALFVSKIYQLIFEHSKKLFSKK